MFIKEITSGAHFLEGRRFVDKTVHGMYKGNNISINTTYMDGKPITKKYTIIGKNFVKDFWKKVKTGRKLDVKG